MMFSLSSTDCHTRLRRVRNDAGVGFRRRRRSQTSPLRLGFECMRIIAEKPSFGKGKSLTNAAQMYKIRAFPKAFVDIPPPNR